MGSPPHPAQQRLSQHASLLRELDNLEQRFRDPSDSDAQASKHPDRIATRGRDALGMGFGDKFEASQGASGASRKGRASKRTGVTAAKRRGKHSSSTPPLVRAST
jgi:hypothetical protein